MEKLIDRDEFLKYFKNRFEKKSTVKSYESEANVKKEYYDPKKDMFVCRKCGEPTIKKIMMFEGIPEIRRVICKCDVWDKENNEKREAEIAKQNQIKELKKSSLLGQRYIGCSFEDTRVIIPQFKESVELCQVYALEASAMKDIGKGLFLYGNPGCGKTHLISCMANYMTENLHACLFTNVSEILKSIKATFKNQYQDTEKKIMDRLGNVDFLFLDDLGAEQVQRNDEDTWAQEKIFDVINTRYNKKLPVIITSNYSIDQLKDDRGVHQRTLDRIRSTCTVMRVKAPNYRQMEFQENNVKR